MRVSQRSSTPQKDRKKSGSDPRGVFLSYRRADSQAWVGRLADDLRSYYGRDRIYLDLDSNRPAQDYIVQVQEALKASRAVIAVVGPQWEMQGGAADDSRLNNPNDLLRRELETALHDGIALLIVLVGGARPPSPDKLPSSLTPLTRLQTLRLADTDWSYDFGRVVEALERHGLYPAREVEGTPPGELSETLLGARRYERT